MMDGGGRPHVAQEPAGKRKLAPGQRRKKTTWTKQNISFRGEELRGVCKSELKSDGIERGKKILSAEKSSMRNPG